MKLDRRTLIALGAAGVAGLGGFAYFGREEENVTRRTVDIAGERGQR